MPNTSLSLSFSLPPSLSHHRSISYLKHLFLSLSLSLPLSGILGSLTNQSSLSLSLSRSSSLITDPLYDPFETRSKSRDDPELDRMCKERVRWGDPMAHLVKKKYPELVLSDLGDDDKMKESGFIVPQGIPSHSWLKRGFDAPPNRYAIRPGRHWDGVDHSNGFEKEIFKRTNEKQATEREAYLWSVSDM
ncbi:hypothetical protein HYC85_026867 [Camellia sinensis]|uniref:BUD13 homolog n=1 Tax=Camellia sinensis TaxID=4442 RepID=A0A7J7G8F7_CAMSI|nr:hypothetical protein HYC85_026867 [Camellia sinensis]